VLNKCFELFELILDFFCSLWAAKRCIGSELAASQNRDPMTPGMSPGIQYTVSDLLDRLDLCGDELVRVGKTLKSRLLTMNIRKVGVNGTSILERNRFNHAPYTQSQLLRSIGMLLKLVLPLTDLSSKILPFSEDLFLVFSRTCACRSTIVWCPYNHPTMLEKGEATPFLNSQPVSIGTRFFASLHAKFTFSLKEFWCSDCR
jgi:hypothetical protein